MRLFYPVKEMFLTLQGEGAHAGSRAVFLRFAGCNVWSGQEKDRQRDTAKGCCAAWCDTDFVGTDGTLGGKLLAADIAERVQTLWARSDSPLVVMTGGEPSLVVDDRLVDELHRANARVHVETNGSHALPLDIEWITLSPKPPMPVLPQHYDEVKVVYPAVDPAPYARHAEQLFIQPLDQPGSNSVERAVNFVLANPEWRLSLQTHKLLGLR